MSNQRFTSFLALVVAVATLHSCKKTEKKTYTVDLHTTSASIKIPATTYTTSSISYVPSVVPYNVDSFIRAQTGTSLGVNDIKTVHLVSATFTLLDTTAANSLANFESVASTFTSEKSTTPYTVSINGVYDVQWYTINLPADSTELKGYFGHIFSYTVSGKLRRATTADLHCKVEYVFKIDVEG